MVAIDSQKICFFNSTKAWGGGEKWHFDVALRLHQKGYPVFFVSNKHSALAGRLKETTIPSGVISIGNLSFLNVFKIWQLKNIFKQQQVTVIVMNLPSDIKAAGIAARRAGIKKIIYRRGSAVPIKNSILNRFLFKHIITDVIANSEATKKTILEKNPNLFPEQKIRVIYNGIEFNAPVNTNIQKFYDAGSDEILLGNASRMVFQKGHEYLIEVAAILKQEGIKFKLLLAGSGPLEQNIKELALQKGLTNEILFLGFVDDVASFMYSIDIFLLTSRWEGFGFVLAEAMAAGKPIVAFDISSNPELVHHGENGFLAEAFNTQEFAGYLITLIKNKTLQDNFGKKGLDMVHNMFSFDRVVAELIDMIKS